MDKSPAELGGMTKTLASALTRRDTALKAAAASKPYPALPVSVSLNVMLCRMLCVLNGMDMVAVRQVPVMGGG